MTSIKILAIATLPVLALLAFPQAASARGGGGVSFRSAGPNQMINTQATFTVHNTNGGLNTNLIQVPLTPPPAPLPPRGRSQPRTM